MDTPKRKVSWLESFPPDIWAYFVCYIPGDQLGRLMMTGATSLLERLKSTRVVKYITLGTDFVVFKSPPKFLNDFPSLEELSIHSLSNEWSRKLALKLDSIPSGVRMLTLTGFWDKYSDRLFGEKCATLKLNEHLPHLESLDVSWLKFESYSWVTHSPPCLTYLALYRWNGTTKLPTSLIHFQVANADLTADSIVSKRTPLEIPPFLESFVVSQELDGVDVLLPLLPPSIRVLNLGYKFSYSYGPRNPENILELLPKSLTWLRVPDDREIKFVSNPELALLLPSTITELRITPDLPYSAWPFLPPRLTKLVCSSPEPLSSEVQSIPFDYLPRSITDLELTESHLGLHCCGPPSSNQFYFPPYLTHLCIADIQLSPEAAKLLPSSLTHLTIGFFCQQVCQLLPTGLRTLTSSRTLMSPNLVPFLPKSLTCLLLSVESSDDAWFEYDSQARESFHYNCAESYDWENSTPLPSTIIHINLPHADELGDSFLLHQKLPSLRELSLANSQHFSDASMPHLPPLLTTLDLSSSTKISGKSFEFLPRCLTFFKLQRSESIFDPDIQHLPRTLKFAEFGHAIHLTALCISDLPPHLEHLNLARNSQITPSSFPSFPYPLRSSKLYRPLIFADWFVHMGVVRHTQNGVANLEDLFLGY